MKNLIAPLLLAGALIFITPRLTDIVSFEVQAGLLIFGLGFMTLVLLRWVRQGGGLSDTWRGIFLVLFSFCHVYSNLTKIIQIAQGSHPLEREDWLNVGLSTAVIIAMLLLLLQLLQYHFPFLFYRPPTDRK